MAVGKMSHAERVVAGLQNQPIDRPLVWPLTCGFNRTLLGYTYEEISKDARKLGETWAAGYREWEYDAILGLIDLSVISADVGTKLRYPLENTTMPIEPAIKTVEDYEKLEVPDVRKGRMGYVIEAVKVTREKAPDAVFTPLVEGPLLALTQSAYAERVLMDMYYHPEAVLKAVKTFVEIDKEYITAIGETGAANGIVMDYLWNNMSCLGAEQYKKFEGQFIPEINKTIIDSGMAYIIHNCADEPMHHLHFEETDPTPAAYSWCYYPHIERSWSADKLVKKYAEKAVIAGNLDPQLWVRATVDEMKEATLKLLKESQRALKDSGNVSRFCICSGCEIPPALTTKAENIRATVEIVNKYGPEYQADLNKLAKA